MTFYNSGPVASKLSASHKFHGSNLGHNTNFSVASVLYVHPVNSGMNDIMIT